MSTRRSIHRLAPLLALVFFGFLVRCGGGRPVVLRPDAAAASLSGLVVKGRVSGATVTAYSLSAAGTRGVALASATTDASGAFTLTELPSYNGPLLLVATGGTYLEESVPDTAVRLESQELTYLIGNYTNGSTMQGIAITPISHLAAGLAVHWVSAEGKPVADAIDEAWLHLNNHFGGLLGGGLDWRTVAPADLTSPGSGQLDAAGKAGVLLAALSMEARGIAEHAGLTPGAALSSLSLVEALYADVSADGYFDERTDDGSIVLPSGGFVADAGPTATMLDGQTLRFALGQSVQRFVASDRNQAGLTLNDVLPLIQQLASNSDARIFRSAGLDYDHEPPIVIFSAKFTHDGSAMHDPVGVLQLVGGSVLVTADAIDASTIQDVSLTANGKPLTASTSGSGEHLVLTAQLATTADGPLTLAAQARDVHGNVGTTTYVLTVDNTPPTITVNTGSPTAGAFYSTAVPVDVSASDLHGVLTLTQGGLDGFTNLSGVSDRLTGTWPVPASRPDGPLSVVLTATDSAFNVATIPLPLKIDRTPPTVALTTPLPPRYTSSSTVTLHVTAADMGAGVSAVKASVNGAPDVTATPNNGVWDIPLDLGLEGNKQVVVWAVDNAQPSANSGYGTALVVNVTRDATNPAPIIPSIDSYYDERPAYTTNGISSPGMGLQSDNTGKVVVPPIYTFPIAAAKVAVVGAGHVYKVATRLSWGAAQPTAPQLYAQDGVHLNVPFLVYEVPVTNSEAPISATATYTVTCAACASFPQASGQLIHDPAFAANPQRFLLPLSSETIPGLTQLNGSQQLVVHASFTDLAGNQTTHIVTVNFHVLGPPLLAVQDPNYASAADPRSIFGYRTGPAQNYAALFDSSNPQFTNGGARVIRYLVQNPAPVPVAVSVTLASGSYAHTETWSDVIANANGGSYPDASGFYTSSACGTPYWTPSPAPCGGLASTNPLALYRGNYPSTCTMPYSQIPAQGAWTNAPSAVGAGSLASTTVAQVPTDSLNAPAIQGSSTFVLVPPAVGSTPGMVAVYVNRPASVSRAIPIQLADVLALSGAAFGPYGYSYTIEDFWFPIGYPYQCCIEPMDPDNPICYPTGSQDFSLRRHARGLVSAVTTASGSLNISSQPVDSTGGQLLGEPSALATSLPFSVSFTH